MIYLEILMGSFILVLVLLIVMLFKNRSLKTEVHKLKEILEAKDSTVEKVEAAPAEVKGEMNHVSSGNDVMDLVEAGESLESISEILAMPVNKIELIIKFDKIKKEQQN